MPSYTEIFDAADGPADLAVVLLAGAAGLFGDAVLSIHGAPSPGTVSATAAAGALGVKKTYQAGRQRKKAQKRASRMIKQLKETSKCPGDRERLNKDLQLYKQGLIDDAELNQSVNEAVAAYRAEDAP